MKLVARTSYECWVQHTKFAIDYENDCLGKFTFFQTYVKLKFWVGQ